jgi:hypothetical protein
MANFSISNLVQAQAILSAPFQSPEMRRALSPILQLGSKNAEILIPSHKTLRTREDRAISAYILKRNARSTIGVNRMANHTGTIGDSLETDITWTSFADKFEMSLKLLDNNMYDFNEVLANQLMQAMMNIRNGAETWLAGWLFSEKTTVNAATQNGSFDSTNSAFVVDGAVAGRFWQMAKSMMRQNDYAGVYDVIADPKSYANAEFAAAQGTSNATNYGFQFSDMNFAQSNDLADPNYTNGVSLVLPANTFGVLNWIPRQNREGWGDYNTTVGGYGSIVDPVTGITMALHGWARQADTSALNGNTQDVVMEFEVSVELSANLAPLSAAGESVVFEVAQGPDA